MALIISPGYRASYLRYVDEFAIGSCGWTYAVATVALAADAI